jgi:hypothetical protein
LFHFAWLFYIAADRLRSAILRGQWMEQPKKSLKTIESRAATVVLTEPSSLEISRNPLARSIA